MEYEQLSMDEQVIKKYQQDEQIMIQLFAQWCVNHAINPHKLYAKAYPEQQENPELQKVLKEMNDDEQMDIDNETMLDVLQLFGNYDLAFVVSEEIEHIRRREING